MPEKPTYKQLKQRILELEEAEFKRKLAEEKLQRSEMLLKETQKISKVGGWEYDVQTQVSTFTDMIFSIYGKTFSDPGQGINFYHKDDREVVLQSFKNAIAKNESYDIEVRFFNAQGDNLWVRTIGRPVVEDGKVVRILGNLVDITERKKAEQNREELIKKLQDALENIKILSGLLPICSSCKKIRDDKGYWNQIEAYIQERSEAEFSHGICPECSDKFYGKDDWYIKMKLDEKNKDH